jgi:hypothetical protein
MLNILRSLDCFGSSIRLKVKTEYGTSSKYKSVIGALITFSCLVPMIIYSYFVLERLFSGFYDRLSEESQKVEIQQPIDLKEVFFMPFFKFKPDQYYDPEEYDVSGLLRDTSTNSGNFYFD